MDVPRLDSIYSGWYPHRNNDMFTIPFREWGMEPRCLGSNNTYCGHWAICVEEIQILWNHPWFVVIFVFIERKISDVSN